MSDQNFWQYVIKMFRNLPLGMKAAWLLAPPMALILLIAVILSPFVAKASEQNLAGCL